MKLIILSHSPVCHIVCSLGQFLVGWQLGYSAEDKMERHYCLNTFTVLNSKILRLEWLPGMSAGGR